MLLLKLQRLKVEAIRCVGLPVIEPLGQLAPQNVGSISFVPGRIRLASVFLRLDQSINDHRVRRVLKILFC